MRGLTPFLPLVLLAACGQPAPNQAQPRSDRLAVMEVQSSPSAFEPPASRVAAGPSVAPAAAPGVAFNYRYAFRLSATRIAGVQEQHAQACERLGVSRCRITGMLYRVASANNIEAMLALKLDPAIARTFGRGAVASVGRAQGMLTESEITGLDAGAAIRRADRNIVEMEEQLGRIDAQLRDRRPSAGERQNLEFQAQQLRQSIAANRTERDETREGLADTPMAFNYASGAPATETPQRPAIGQALSRAVENFGNGATMLLIVLITLFPWALTAGLIWWAIRKFARRRWAALTQEPNPHEGTIQA